MVPWGWWQRRGECWRGGSTRSSSCTGPGPRRSTRCDPLRKTWTHSWAAPRLSCGGTVLGNTMTQVFKHAHRSKHCMQCCGFVTFWYGSETADPCLWQMDPDSDPILDASVADPDPGLGAFLTPGSGIRDGRKSASGSRIRDEQPGSYFLNL